MNKLKYLFLLVGFLAIISCQKDDAPEITQYEKFKISGLIQKGPFINGTSLMISELNLTLNPTGKVFNTQIINNKGAFELRNVTLSSKYVELIANGFYFNENTGAISSSQLTLRALSDLSDSSTINVNILTELEKSRVEYLVSQGKDFKSAKNQAQQEILKIFELKDSNLKSSEYLDITKNEEDNAVLLAISIIVQGLRTEAELSELIAAIKTDLKEDGVLNNQRLGEKLIQDVKLMYLPEVRENIRSRYTDLGATIDIPDFEKYIQHFIENTKFVAPSGIEYSKIGKYGPNLLALDQFEYPGGNPAKFSISAKMAKGTSLKVIVYPDYINETIIVAEPKNITIPGHYSSLGYALYTSDWRGDNSSYNKDGSMILYNIDSDKIVECEVHAFKNGSATIEIYENNQLTPTRIKKIKW